MKRLASWALVVATLLGSGAAAQEGRPAPWALKFTHGPLQTYSLTFKDGTSRTYYYLTFTVENTSQQDASLALNVKAVVGDNPRKQQTLVAIPAPHAEEAIRRLGREPDRKNVQQINAMKTLAPGASAKGIAVLGTFNREWDKASVHVSGLEPYSRTCRVRKWGDAGFTMPHRAYFHHNQAVREAAGKDATFKDVVAIVRHDVEWVMQFHRQGDEFAPQVDPIIMDSEEWRVNGAKIIHEVKAPFAANN